MTHDRKMALTGLLAALAVAATLGAAAAHQADTTNEPDSASTWSLASGIDPDAAPRRVLGHIDLSDQTMMVYVDQVLVHTFKVSTGRGSYRTPTGHWNAAWLSPKHRSRKYNLAPMPWSVFYYKGYAVHGTTEVKRLGQPASHGCVRLHPDNAKIFYKLVEAAGKQNTLISVVD